MMNVSASELSCRGQTENIDKDITADQCGSTQAGGLITERDAGKQSRVQWFKLLWRQTCRCMSSGRQRGETNRGNRQRPNGIYNIVGCFVKLPVSARRLRFVDTEKHQ